jgi:hypothetical protein
MLFPRLVSKLDAQKATFFTKILPVYNQLKINLLDCKKKLITLMTKNKSK